MDKSPPAIEILPMETAWILESFQLERECGLEPWTIDDFYQILEEGDRWVALIAQLATTQEHKIVGTCLARYAGREMELCKIATRKEYRRFHVGTQMLTSLFTEGRRRCCQMCFLEVRVSNRGAIRFYESLSFRLLGKRPRYYSHPEEDALIMGREL